TSSYEPSTATTSPPYTAVVTTLPASRSCGMKTIDGTPARAAWAATELARLPVEAQAKRVKPNPRAAVSAVETTRSLNEWVGLAEASLLLSVGRSPTASPTASARTRGVSPGSRVTRVDGSWPTGSSGAYRQMFAGPASTRARVTAARWAVS